MLFSMYPKNDVLKKYIDFSIYFLLFYEIVFICDFLLFAFIIYNILCFEIFFSNLK